MKTRLVDVDNNTVLSRYVSYARQKKPTQIINYALDGTPYIQTVGTPNSEITVKAYVKAAEQELVDNAWADVSIVRIEVGKIKIYGYITNVNYGERMAQGWYLATITISEVLTP